MLNVNVIADDSRRSEFWIVPDLIVVVGLIGIWAAARWVTIGVLDAQLQAVHDEMAVLQSSVDRLNKEVETIGDLNQQLSSLESRHQTLSSLNDQQVLRYRPIILMDLLQNAKPAKLWFESIDFLQPDSSLVESGNWPRSIRVIGRSSEQVEIADFVRKLHDTSAVPLVKNDPRTQLYFENVRLVNLIRRESIGNHAADGVTVPEVAPFYEFIVEFQFYERAT